MIIEFQNQIKKFNNIWFIGCTHFSHYNIINLCNRPFTTVEQMDYTLLQNINNNVQENDLLIHLGDFCQWKDKPTKTFYETMDKINCKNFFFALGNHDLKIKSAIKQHKKVIHYGDILDLQIDSQYIVCSHYPLISWNRQYYGSRMLHAHTHNQIFDIKNLLNVCVEQTHYKPLSFKDVQERTGVKNEIKT